MSYKVEVIEVLSRIVEIDAEDSDDAIEIAKDMYYNEDVILDYNDVQNTEFNVI